MDILDRIKILELEKEWLIEEYVLTLVSYVFNKHSDVIRENLINDLNKYIDNYLSEQELLKIIIEEENND